MKISDILLVLMILSFIVGTVGICHMFMMGTHIEKTECYDRFANKINGIDCDKGVYNEPFPLYGLIGVCVGLVFFMLWVCARVRESR